MNKLSNIGSLLKRLYRIYSGEVLTILQSRGFTDLRASFLEVLLYICEHNGPSIKSIGDGCGLTMTSHLNELEKRGYIERRINPRDKREQNILLTEYGEKFKFALFEAVEKIETQYEQIFGNVEIDRVELLLTNFHEKITASTKESDELKQSAAQGAFL